MKNTHPARSNRLLFAWAFLALLGSVAACFVPLLRTLGYEFSLFASLLVALGGGHIAACYPHRVRTQTARFPGARFPTLILYGRALATAIPMALTPLLVALINRVVTPPCNEFLGVIFYLLMPMGSLLLATAVGLFFGLLFPGPRMASLAWFLVFISSVALAFVAFYSGPAVYIFGPFFGYFPGVLYDLLVTVETRLVTYRIGTIVQTGLVLSLVSLSLDLTRLRLAFTRSFLNPKKLFQAFLMGCLATGFYLAGPILGHRTDRAHLEETLSKIVETPRLNFYFDPSIDPQLADELIEDAEFSLFQVEQYLGIRAKEPISVFFFASRQQRGALMGASGTNVAKPWRHEVYVTAASPPHMVLRHELVHAVGASIGQGPFAISGGFGGLLPNPGFIEGLAVAAGGQRNELTIHGWAAAMKHIGLLPRLESIFGFGFFNHAASSAYTAAGSFCDYIHEKHGKKVLTKAYTAGDWKTATGQKLEDLEKEWLAFIQTITLRAQDLAAAKQRFDRPAVVHSVCVHEVARLLSDAQDLAANNSWNPAIQKYKEALDVSKNATSARLGLFFTLCDAGKTKPVRQMGHELLLDDTISSISQKGIEEILADMDYEEGKTEKAKGIYSKLEKAVADEGTIRRLQTKSYLAGFQEKSIKPLMRVLYFRPGPRTISEPLSMLLIADAHDDLKKDPVVTYLLARQHFRYRNYPRARQLFHLAESLGLAGVSIDLLLASKMATGESLLKMGEGKLARDVFDHIAKDASFRDGARSRAVDWVERCDYKLHKKDR